MKKQITICSIAIFILTANAIAQTNTRLKMTKLNQEQSVNKSSNIRINSDNRNVEIQTWQQDKIKISHEDAANVTEGDEYSLEKMGVSVRELGGNINISIKQENYSCSGCSGIDDRNKKKNIIVYVPQSAKLLVDSKYGNLSFRNAVNQLELDVTNGNVDAEDIKNLQLVSKYSNFTCNTIESAAIDFINGRLTMSSCKELDLDTKYSTVEISVVRQLAFTSTNDDYEIEEVDVIKGRKNYGNVRIAKLTGLLEMDGTNADIKVRTITSSVSSIKLDDKYSDIRLPLKNLKNYSIEVKGEYNTVYPDKSASNFSTNDVSSFGSTFKAAIGDGSGTKINIKCQNCTVDFK